MKKLNNKINIDDTLLDHELDFISNSPNVEFTQYLIDNKVDSGNLINHFDSAFNNLLENQPSLHSINAIERKRSILEELVIHARTLGITVQLEMSDIPDLVEEELDVYILQFAPGNEDEIFGEE